MASPSIHARVQQQVGGLAGDRVVLAVSGGVDSMVMLHAAAAVLPAARLVVATFDHASGPHTAAAVDLVQRTALSHCLPIVVGTAQPVDRPSEAAWRDARLAFLRAVAVEYRAAIMTAHTRDDQVETVLFREMRGAGTRGLAGLAAPGATVRPLLPFLRRDLTDYARTAGVEWVDDPTNRDRAFARNRIRHDLLPALRQVAPSIDDELADIGARAARWRAELRAAVDQRVRFEAHPEGWLEVETASLRKYTDEALGIVWPELLARVGLAVDRRGTRRLVAFTTSGSAGQRIQLSGGWTVHRRRHGFEVRKQGPTER